VRRVGGTKWTRLICSTHTYTLLEHQDGEVGCQ
jgi:hypothetical protein